MCKQQQHTYCVLGKVCRRRDKPHHSSHALPYSPQSPPLISACTVCTPLCMQMGHANRDVQLPPPHCNAPSQRYTPLLLSSYPPLSTCSQNGGTHTPCFCAHAIWAPTLYAPPPIGAPPQPPPLCPSPPLHVCPPPFPCALLAMCRKWGVDTRTPCLRTRVQMGSAYRVCKGVCVCMRAPPPQFLHAPLPCLPHA